MFSLAILTLASLSASASARAIPRNTTPSTYFEGYLEPYKTYNTRYLALDCQDKHDTPFFDACCHPMLATENLKDNRAPECTPSPEASSSAAAVEPTSTVKPDDGDDDCTDDDGDSSIADPAPTAAPKPKPSEAPKPTEVANAAPEPPKPSDEPKSSDKPKPSDAPAPKPAPKPSPKPSSGGGLGGLAGAIGKIFEGGIATFFFQNGVAGNCGTVHKDTDFVVALETSTYANGAHCGKKVILQDANSGHTEYATIADSCPTCKNPESIDLSYALFHAFASDADGIFPLKWAFAS